MSKKTRKENAKPAKKKNIFKQLSKVRKEVKKQVKSIHTIDSLAIRVSRLEEEVYGVGV